MRDTELLPWPNKRRGSSRPASETLELAPDGTAIAHVAPCAEWKLDARVQLPAELSPEVAASAELAPLLRGRTITWSAETAGAWPPPPEIRLVLVPSCCVAGRVVDAKNEAIEGAVVSLAHDRIEGYGRTTTKVVTDADGVFVFGDLRPGPAELDVLASLDYVPREQPLQILSGVEQLEVVLERVLSITGIVRGPDGAPLTGARVSLESHGDLAPEEGLRRAFEKLERGIFGPRPAPLPRMNSVTDKEGRFRIDHVPPGWTRLVASTSTLVASAPVDVLASAAGPPVVELWPRLPGSLEVRILEGEAHSVEARDTRTHPFLVDGPKNFAVPSGSGVWTFPKLVPGRYVVRATLGKRDEGPERSEEASSHEGFQRSAEVDVHAGRPSFVDLAPPR